MCVCTRAVEGVKTIPLLFYIFWWVLGEKMIVSILRNIMASEVGITLFKMPMQIH